MWLECNLVFLQILAGLQPRTTSRGPPGRSTRKKEPEESFRELGRAIKKLSTLAYNCNYEVREKLAKSDFINAVQDRELRIMILQGRPSNLEEAIQLAEENAGYRKWAGDMDSKSTKSQVRNVINANDENTLVECIKANTECMKQIRETMNKVTTQQDGRKRRPRSDITCWTCGLEVIIALNVKKHVIRETTPDR